MRYTLREILSNTSSYLFFKQGNNMWDKNYRPTILLKEIKPKQDMIFFPFYSIVNNVPTETFSDIESAIIKGARAFAFDEEYLRNPRYQKMLYEILRKYKDRIDFVIMAKNSLGAIMEIAQYTRVRKFSKDLKVICVTGSIGKTSTTEMLYCVLKQKHKVFRGEPMVNLRVRINHKLIEAEPDCEYLLFECSGATKGYLKNFSELLMPDGMILSKVGTENLGKYGSLQGIADEKCTLMSCMGEKAVAVLDDSEETKKASKEYICKKIFPQEGNYELIKTDKNGSKFKYKGEEYALSVVGEHQINNAIKVIELAKSLNIDDESIKKGLFGFKPVGSRWLVDDYNEATVVTDAPNNPSYETIISCINTFMNIYKDYPQKRIMISGIRELGKYEKEVHLKLAEFISKLNIDELICVEKEAKTVYDYISQNAAHIKSVYFEKPKELNEKDPFVNYIINSLNTKQALLIKGQGIDPKIQYEKVRIILNRVIKGEY